MPVSTRKSVRKTIRFLQIYPIVTSIALLVDIICDIFGIVITNFLGILFGTSLYITIGLYAISRSLYVATWSKSLYITLIVAVLFDFTDQLFHLPINAVIFNNILLLIFVIGILSSLCTFIYDKFKYKF